MTAPAIAGILLAGGFSSRTGKINKLTAETGGGIMVRRCAKTLLESRAHPVIVVLGHEADAVQNALHGMELIFTRGNPEPGLSSSLKRGLAALPGDIDGVLVCLADMPLVAARHLDALIAAFEEGDDPICVPSVAGKRGNPVLWPARFFADIAALDGDRGAQGLMKKHADCIRPVSFNDTATLTDVDTMDDLDQIGRFGASSSP